MNCDYAKKAFSRPIQAVRGYKIDLLYYWVRALIELF